MYSSHRASPPTRNHEYDDDRPLATYLEGNHRHENRPLIEQVHNAWRSEKNNRSGYSSDDDDFPDEIPHCCDLDSEDSFVGAVAAIIRTRRFRRTVLYTFIALLSIFTYYRVLVKPGQDLERLLVQGFNNPIGTFGMEDPQKFKGMIQTQELSPEYVPGGDNDPEGKRRLIFVGDIHGCRKELQALMDKVHFNKETDHLICTGDVISKGPDSLGVVDTLISLNASSVRGNHEDKVLIVGDRTSETSDLDWETRKSKAANLKGEDLAPYLLPSHLKWLRSLPLILHIPALNPPSIQAPEALESELEDPDLIAESKKKKKKKNKGKKKFKHIPDILTDVNVVHGGLVPGLPLTRQDPYAVMNMRSMSPTSHVPSSERDRGVPWESIWGWYNDRLDRHQKTKTFSWFTEDYEPEDQSSVEEVEGGQGEEGSKQVPSNWRGWLDPLFGRNGDNNEDLLGTLRNQKPSVVVYGHDSPRGLNLNRWSKGLDSGCAHGRQLTAMVVDAWGQARLVQTKCKMNL